MLTRSGIQLQTQIYCGCIKNNRRVIEKITQNIQLNSIAKCRAFNVNAGGTYNYCFVASV
jgi:hypothetical protein